MIEQREWKIWKSVVEVVLFLQILRSVILTAWWIRYLFPGGHPMRRSTADVFQAWYLGCSLFVGVFLVRLFASSVEGDSTLVIRGKTGKLLSAFGILMTIEGIKNLVMLAKTKMDKK